jgi:hypothetical protein
MPLSEDDQRKCDEIEQSLLDEDPVFSTTITIVRPITAPGCAGRRRVSLRRHRAGADRFGVDAGIGGVGCAHLGSRSLRPASTRSLTSPSGFAPGAAVR